MALKVLGSISSKRLSFLLGVPKPTSGSLPDSQQGDNHSLPPLIERQAISPELESEIRYASALLYYSIEHQETTLYSQQLQRDAPNKRVDVTKTGVGITADYLSPSACPDKGSQEGKHDSGIGMGEQQPNNHAPFAQGVPRFYKQQNPEILAGRSSASTTASASPIRRTMSDGRLDTNYRCMDERDTAVEASSNSRLFQHLCDEAFNAGGQGNLHARSDDGEVFINADTTSRVPSFYWPGIESRCLQKQHSEDPQSPSKLESKANSEVPENLPPYPARQEPSEGMPNRPATAIGMGAIVHRSSWQEEAVIVDKDGLMRVMSAAESTQRQRDLQRAVMEKMCTGVIGASAQVTELHIDNPLSPRESSQQHRTASSKEEPRQQPVETATREVSAAQPQREKPGLLRKLSIFGIGRRKTIASVNRDSVGFSRIVEAV